MRAAKSISASILFLIFGVAHADQYDDYAHKQDYAEWTQFLATAKEFGTAAECGVVDSSFSNGAVMQLSSYFNGKIRITDDQGRSYNLPYLAKQAFDTGRKAAKVAGACDYFPAHPEEVVRMRRLITLALGGQ